MLFKGKEVNLPDSVEDWMIEALESCDVLEDYINDEDSLIEVALGKSDHVIINYIGLENVDMGVDEAFGYYIADNYLDFHGDETLKNYFNYKKYGKDIREEYSGKYHTWKGTERDYRHEFITRCKFFVIEEVW